MRPGQVLAWCAHAYTALGLVLGALAAVVIVEGSDAALRRALLLFFLATLVDASDGVLARRFRVHETLPGFDGRRLDDLIDFQLYTSLPLLLIWRSGLLPGGWAALLLAPLLASAYGFSRRDAKTDDGAFTGFPSCWNVVAFYVYFLRPPVAVTGGVLLALSVLTFVPTTYLYPSMSGTANRRAAVLGAVWAVAILLVLAEAVPAPGLWVRASLAYPAYYMLASWAGSRRRKARGSRPA
jgi:phosphatidylcholine synthase